MVSRVAAGLLEAALQMLCDRKQSRIEDTGQIGRLINRSGDNVVVGHRSELGGRMTMLFADHIQDGLLNMEQNVLATGHIAVNDRELFRV